MKNIETIAQVYRGSNDKQNKLSFTVLIEQSREQKEITVLFSTLAIKKLNKEATKHCYQTSSVYNDELS